MDKLLLQSKPMSEMTDEELRAGIAELQAKREALVAENRKKHQETLAAGTAPKKERAKKEPDSFAAGMFANLKAAAEKAKK